ncbi:ATP-binding protein [Patulibacter minatonensis]|uniref:ATP-binding protein n=1 Tax=Patulibacter minatonensis TaxID=298163 RepID=UPI00047AD38C|nr:LuxR family transcriptional regulator [Patulibacter minatonensis]
MGPSGDRTAGPLAERTHELALLRERVAGAAAGLGAVVRVEGPAGRGKSALLRAVRDGVDDSVRCLTAVGGELERDFPFGVVRQLLEPVLHAADDDERARLLAGASGAAAPLFGIGTPVAQGADDAPFAILHGLYWLVATLTEDRPLVLVVDDLHWADPASLRFVSFLARRTADLPLFLLVGTRPAEPGSDRELLDAIADAPEVETLRPAELSADGVAAVVAGRGLAADAGALRAAHRTTAGNPLLLHELLRELGTTPLDEAGVLRAVPPSVIRSVQRRVQRLDADEREVARALAVLGERRPVGALASITGRSAATVLRALDVLARVELVEDDPPRFVHPLVRTALLRGLPAGQLAELHLQCAVALRSRDDADDEDVALHLLGCPAVGEPWAADALRASARRAATDGDPDAAVRRLVRAAEEPAEGPERAALLLDLGIAQIRTHAPDAEATLTRATVAADDAVAVAALEARSSLRVRLDAAAIDAAADDLQSALDRLGPDGDPVTVQRLRGRLLGAMSLTGRLSDQRRELLARWTAEPDPGLALRQVDAFERAARGAPASEVRGLVEGLRGALGRLATIETQVLWGVFAAVFCDLTDLATDQLAEARATARRAGSPYAMSLLAHMEVPLLLRSGSVLRAEALARDTLDAAVRGGFAQPRAQMTAEIAEALVLQGRLDEADALIAGLPEDAWEGRTNVAWLSGTRGRLRLAQRRPADAVLDLRRVDELRVEEGWALWPRLHDGASLALALARAGEQDEALARAAAEAALARRREVPSHEAEALLARAAAEPAADRAATTEEAVAAARRGPSPTILAGALFDHGRELRLARSPSRAREPLREALDVATRCGAALIAGRAEDELLAAGARPRRTALSGLASLTPAERRTGELAAEGLTNREVAETLFVTRKTVEVHLGRVYAKLGIGSRTQLADALSAE